MSAVNEVNVKDLGLAELVDRIGLGATSLGPGQHAAKLARSLHSGRIAVVLREAIVSGRIPVGTPFVEARLAEELSVSRGPIRSVLAVLEGEGLVETKRNGRMIVSGFGADDVRDLFEVRFSLESQAIRWGTDRGGDLADVEAAYGEIVKEGNSTPRLVDLDVNFHRSLVMFSGSRFLTRSWLALAPLIHAVITIGNRRLVERDPRSNFARIVDSHLRLVESLREGDADAAAGMLARQFDLTKSMFGASDAGSSSPE